ncbi:hypothetical protein BREVUG8_20004 [Brevundimonas sp. G8]|nr:hypothetical protein BREVUG8_20004 [Brevundimonas sp. G8]
MSGSGSGGLDHGNTQDPRQIARRREAAARVEHLAGRQKGLQSSWRLLTLRTNAPRAFADEMEAEDAFDMEVIASLTDPTIIAMQRRGLID